MELDKNRENHHLHEMTSVLVSGVVYASTIDLNKKRKLEDDQLGLPLSKHKSINRISSSDLEEQVFLTCLVKKSTDGEGFYDPLKPLEYSNGSNTTTDSFTFTSPEAQSDPEFLKVYTYKQPVKSETESSRTYSYDQPSSSSGSCGSNSFKSILHSLDITSTEKTNIMEEESPTSREPGVQILKNGFQFEEDEFQYHETHEIEECSDGEIYEMMLYNEAPLDSYILSSGRWEVNQDARNTKKPTIDQEFEQYFSMLML